MVQKPPRAERLTLEGPAGGLQALIETPVSEAGKSPEATSARAGTRGPEARPGTGTSGEPLTGRAFAVVCHPHPLFGGTLDNKVVYTVARAIEQLGVPAIRFNFRGVGASEGSYDEGRGEGDDALAVIGFGRRRWPQAALWLAGFSFGGAVAVRVAAQAQAERLVLVAPGITRLERTDFKAARAAVPACPWLIVQGDADDVVPAAAVLSWAGSRTPAPGVPAPQLSMLPGAGHFFHGRLSELRDAVLAFLR